MTAGIQSREIGSDRVRSITGESINHHQRQVNSGITLPNELWQLRESGERDIREVREIRIYIYKKNRIYLFQARGFTIFMNFYI